MYRGAPDPIERVTPFSVSGFSLTGSRARAEFLEFIFLGKWVRAAPILIASRPLEAHFPIFRAVNSNPKGLQPLIHVNLLPDSPKGLVFASRFR